MKKSTGTVEKILKKMRLDVKQMDIMIYNRIMDVNDGQ